MLKITFIVLLSIVLLSCTKSSISFGGDYLADGSCVYGADVTTISDEILSFSLDNNVLHYQVWDLLYQGHGEFRYAVGDATYEITMTARFEGDSVFFTRVSYFYYEEPTTKIVTLAGLRI